MTIRTAALALSFAVALPGANTPTPLSALVEEAGRDNPDILAARSGWQAATQVPSQISTLPDP